MISRITLFNKTDSIEAIPHESMDEPQCTHEFLDDMECWTHVHALAKLVDGHVGVDGGKNKGNHLRVVMQLLTRNVVSLVVHAHWSYNAPFRLKDIRAAM